MNDVFNQQKDILATLKQEISLLHQQVDYLIRNEKELGLLDLDVMMNRTHTIYDQLCSINIGTMPEEEQPDDEELPVEPKVVASLFGIEEEEAPQEDPQEEETPREEEAPQEEIRQEEIPYEEETPETEEKPVPQEEEKEDVGFILNFEPTEEEPVPDVTEEEIPYEPVIFGNMEEKEDASFELDQPETLGERLQHSSINDLRSAIGINDKFLLVNELFGGSMEKYNRSIENLNDLKTLNGALIYMNELRIELQWNSNNEAYKKLLELVHRKYEG